MNTEFDAIVIGAGIYGLYATQRLAEKKRKVALIEAEPAPFQRASYVNQARIHNGYHYPRSFSTALKSAHYFDRFNSDFAFAVNRAFKSIYAISHRFSLVSGEQFEKFCHHADIPVSRIDSRLYFADNSVDAAFETKEYTFDAIKIRDYFLEKLSAAPTVRLLYGTRPQRVSVKGTQYAIELTDGSEIQAPLVLNASYASTNQVLSLFGYEPLKIKYEICEIIKCRASSALVDVGITVMDGPFFSLMPFGTSGDHSLSAVMFTPHRTSHAPLPTFRCQTRNPACMPDVLQNCNTCVARPATAWSSMSQLVRKYLIPSMHVDYGESMFAIKPILATSEIDDSRPTLLRTLSRDPTLISVLSGKINTLYDLDPLFQ